MKKRLLTLLLPLALLCVLLCPGALAENTGLGHVRDLTGSLTQEQLDALEYEAERISREQQCGVYIVLIDDYEDYNDADIESCAEGIYRFYELGYGEQRDGLMLIMSMKQREYDLCAFGSFGHTAFTDYGKDYLSRSFLDNFRRDDWYGGFCDYLDTAEDMLISARQGNPLDLVVPEREERRVGPLGKLLAALLPSSAAGLLVCSGDKRKMKNAVRRQTAEDYVVPGGVRLRVRQDLFLHRSRSVEIIESDTKSSGGGGGGTTVNSSGFSHHSGKF